MVVGRAEGGPMLIICAKDSMVFVACKDNAIGIFMCSK